MLVPSHIIILTFNALILPPGGGVHCSIQPYIPNPFHCFQCQVYGHSQQSFHGISVCGHCVQLGQRMPLGVLQLLCALTVRDFMPPIPGIVPGGPKKTTFSTRRHRSNLPARRFSESLHHLQCLTSHPSVPYFVLWLLLYLI